MSGASGAWGVDPFRRHEHRFWDGATWTEHVSDFGRVSGDPLRPGEVAPPPAPLPPMPPPVSAAYVSAPRNNGLAIASMVLGLVWVYWIGSILAVIFGHVALSQIKKSGGARRGRGMAIAGVVLGYVGIALLIVFIVVVATVGVDHDPSANACRADAAAFSAAEDAYFATNNRYATESELVGVFVTNQSDYHDIQLLDGGQHYVLVARHGCD
ncbi:MAG TPA: DUF4190 domain-containing protein [Acidimicrobiia bacterium]